MESNTGIYISENDTGTDPLERDSDGDGVDDGAEIAAGTNPNGEGPLPGSESMRLSPWKYYIYSRQRDE